MVFICDGSHTARAGGPATTRGVVGEITCEKAESIPTTLRWRSGPVAAAVWLWSLRWSSAHVPPVTADTPCCQPKQPWGQPQLRRKERRKLGMRTSVRRPGEPPSELHARGEPRRRQNQRRWGKGGGRALRRIEMCSDGKGRGGECDDRKKRDLRINSKRVRIEPTQARRCNPVDVAGLHPVQCRVGRCEPSPGADVEGRCPMCPVPAQM